LTIDEIHHDLKNLLKFKADDNPRSFYGNPTLYHFQMENLLKCKVKNGSFKDIYDDENKRIKLWNDCHKYAPTTRVNNPPARIFEMYRRLNGCIAFFKATTAMYIYKRLGATKILDPTAGWGGRLLGAWALGLDYTGIDTNTNMEKAYDDMGEVLANYKDTGSECSMIWGNCLDVDFSELDYDFVLTSPPYINLELYENMTPYESDKAFYTKFLIPLLEKCLKHIKGGYVCFNISPKMYKDLCKYDFRSCDLQIDLLQQKIQGIDKGDKIYCWKNKTIV
jgi:hypothetical protein